jgi:hypothetical protein
MYMSEALHCVNHPDVETYLRCNKCGQPICPKCAVRTPVGYRCKNCISAQQQVFYADFRPIHYVIAAVVALPLSFVVGVILPLLGWFVMILGPLAGVAIAEIVRWAIQRRRGRYTWVVVCGCIILGGLPMLLLPLLGMAGAALLGGLGRDIGNVANYAIGGIFGMLWPGAYLVTATGAAYWRLRPGKRV